jgi:hypothetical protein
LSASETHHGEGRIPFRSSHPTAPLRRCFAGRAERVRAARRGNLSVVEFHFSH